MKTFCLVKAFRIKDDLQLSEFSYHHPRANKSTFLCGDSALSEDLKGTGTLQGSCLAGLNLIFALY